MIWANLFSLEFDNIMHGAMLWKQWCFNTTVIKMTKIKLKLKLN